MDFSPAIAGQGEEHSGPHEACGVVGVYCRGADVARIAYFGLFALQHRGQESAGIATADGTSMSVHTSMGLVGQAFTEDILSRLKGHIAIGHTRYSTTGSSRACNAQPFLVNGPAGDMALAHNGNIVNAQPLRSHLQAEGCVFNTTTDSEVIAHVLARAPGATWEERVAHLMRECQGAYSLTVATKDTVLGIRDPLGVRPLCLGKLNGGWVIASESCALDHISAQFLREIEPGEAVIIDSNGLRTWKTSEPKRRALCIFEYIYFARPDSVINQKLLYPVREAMGAQLAREFPVSADLVIGVPDSAIAAAVGYSRESGIPYSEGLVKNRYVGRTFIQPDQRLRELGVRLKFNPLPEVIRDKRLVVVDDSIVRGTTTPQVVSLLRRAGAKEVHLRICAPPIRWPCYFGVDMATQRELIAANMSITEIAQHLGVDSLGYLSMDGLVKAVGLPKNDFCLACFSGQYPIPIQFGLDKMHLEKNDLPSPTALEGK
ncbi:MAG: amidophosphoribosyltransferase [Dehalococcoidia bacterium]|nr:amidophosphoribosyltransferase [Dehalococcoidia bacterium]